MEKTFIPDADTDRVVLVEAKEKLSALIFKAELSVTSFEDQVWYYASSTTSSTLLATFNGKIGQRVVSPDKKYVAFFITDYIDSTSKPYKGEIPGLWLLKLP